jgi:predicted Zn-dependent peptidase
LTNYPIKTIDRTKTDIGVYLHLKLSRGKEIQDHQIETLSNGIRIVHKQVQNSKIAHFGFILDIGSRDETPTQKGLAHFWEHMAFKGTKKRRSFQIINKLDTLGGELNAYTTKKNICFYASVQDKHAEKAIDILSDITFQQHISRKSD